MISDSWREEERGNLVKVEVNLMLGMISYDKDRDIRKDKVWKKSQQLDHFIYRGEIEKWEPEH